ncbi:hypothetical protein OSTOST_04093, partial [Ostertagia ostertagi]
MFVTLETQGADLRSEVQTSGVAPDRAAMWWFWNQSGPHLGRKRGLVDFGSPQASEQEHALVTAIRSIHGRHATPSYMKTIIEYLLKAKERLEILSSRKRGLVDFGSPQASEQEHALVTAIDQFMATPSYMKTIIEYLLEAKERLEILSKTSPYISDGILAGADFIIYNVMGVSTTGIRRKPSCVWSRWIRGVPLRSIRRFYATLKHNGNFGPHALGVSSPTAR